MNGVKFEVENIWILSLRWDTQDASKRGKDCGRDLCERLSRLSLCRFTVQVLLQEECDYPRKNAERTAANRHVKQELRERQAPAVAQTDDQAAARRVVDLYSMMYLVEKAVITPTPCRTVASHT